MSTWRSQSLFHFVECKERLQKVGPTKRSGASGIVRHTSVFQGKNTRQKLNRFVIHELMLLTGPLMV
jgi:hypothetical protein